MLSAFANCFKIPELRHRIIFTLCVVVVVRLGAAIPCPGINTEILARYFHEMLSKQENTVVGLFNLFSGGALENCAIFTLGIIPYISASIMLQLMTAVVPSLGKLAREEGGRAKITQYTRYATIIICVFQGYFYAKQFENPKTSQLFSGIEAITSKYGALVPHPGLTFELTTVLSLLAGTLLLMWFGEQITDKGIGNGISMVITINIVSRLPAALLQGWQMVFPPAGATGSEIPEIVLPIMVLFLFGVIAGTIAITQGAAKSHHPVRQAGPRQQGLRRPDLVPAAQVNYSGVMPIIFAQSILIVPAFTIKILPPGTPLWLREVADSMGRGGSLLLRHLHLDDLLLLLFLGVVHVQPDPDFRGREAQRRVHPRRPPWAAHRRVPRVYHDPPDPRRRDLPRHPGHPAGVANQVLHVPVLTSQFFGGTSLLIMIGVMLDTMRQMETYLLQRHYDGFLKKGRIRGRSSGPMTGPGQGHTADTANYVWLFVVIAVLLIIGAIVSLAY